MKNQVFTPFVLPNGTQLPNRIVKASMEENMAEAGQLPGEALNRLYRTWAHGGTGLLLSGNVMVDSRAMTGPGGVALEAGTPLEPFRRWAEAGKQGGGQFWLQISHPGRQVYAALGGEVWAPSAVPLNLGKHSSLFGQPRAMTEADIAEVIARFAETARLAEAAGFDGVQIHGAHGYLLSQFLSPLANQRTDQWGGSLENRARLLLEVVKAVRAVVSPRFGVGIKLNSADFQRGGFDAEDARQVVQWLNALPVDLVELSGGSYESPAMQGRAADGRTLAREAYFLAFAREIATVATIPVMTTGGIRRLPVAEEVLADGRIALVGIATALAARPDLPKAWQANAEATAALRPVRWKDKTMVAVATMALVRRQLQRMGNGKAPLLHASPLFTLLTDRARLGKLTRRYRSWRATQA